ncbi:hypothetical protein LY78DRAFT_249277 [Colletotrichum sublineola]|nr:hypothetical protein LY78DRAFT_249277 [Colletotrichum sublineola]
MHIRIPTDKGPGKLVRMTTRSPLKTDPALSTAAGASSCVDLASVHPSLRDSHNQRQRAPRLALSRCGTDKKSCAIDFKSLCKPCMPGHRSSSSSSSSSSSIDRETTAICPPPLGRVPPCVSWLFLIAVLVLHSACPSALPTALSIGGPEGFRPVSLPHSASITARS